MLCLWLNFIGKGANRMVNLIPSLLMQYPPSVPPGSQVNNDVDDYLVSAAQLAKQILTPEACGYTQDNRSMGRVKIKHYHMWTPAPVIIAQPAYPYGGNPYGRRDPRNEKNPSDGLRAFAGIAGAILGGYAIYKVGQTLNHLRDAGAEIENNKQFQYRVSDWKRQLTNLGQGGNRNLQALEIISEKRDAIFSRIRGNAFNKLIIAISMVASAVFLIAGAIVGSVPLLALGLTFTLITGAGFLFKLGSMSSDKRDAQDAIIIQREIVGLKGPQFYNAVEVNPS